MMPMPQEEGLEGEADPELEKQLLEELMQFARGGMAEDLKSRHPGPEGEAPMPMGGDEPVPEDPEIPGAEAVPPGEGGAPEAGGLDPEVLKALLAKMQGG